MVLQHSENVKLWGNGIAGSDLIVKTSWNGKEYTTNVGDNGKWELSVSTDSPGGPYEIVFDDGDTVVLSDVYLGEVWLCSGQSNMEMPIKGYLGQPVFNSTKIISEANSDIPIRLFTVEKNYSKEEKDDCKGYWGLNNSLNVSNLVQQHISLDYSYIKL